MKKKIKVVLESKTDMVELAEVLKDQYPLTLVLEVRK